MASKIRSLVQPAVSSEGFDVVATIGHISFSDRGEQSPMEAAMALIGRHNAEARYTFPHEDGGFVHVIVEIERPESERSEPEY